MRPPADPAAHFERKYRNDPDPWSYRSSWYERRKYAITLAGLPQERYSSAWEPGCSIGELTALLATRTNRLDASDLSATAVTAARERTAEMPSVHLTRAVLPYHPPLSSYGLVILSEVLYYLPPKDREDTLRIVDQVSVPGTDLVVVHWRRHPDDAWTAGADVNAGVRDRPGWQPIVHHEESEFVLDVLTREAAAQATPGRRV